MNYTPKRLKRILYLYPPYLGAGVKVTQISQDWTECCVCPCRCIGTIATVGTHFGGSLYSMVDPHLMLLLMQLLGDDALMAGIGQRMLS